MKGVLGVFFNPVTFLFQWLGEYSNTCLRRQIVPLLVTEHSIELKSLESEAVSLLRGWELILIPFAYKGNNLPCKKNFLLKPCK